MAHLGTSERWTNADSAALRVASVKFYHEQMPCFKQAETRGQFTAAHLVDTVLAYADMKVADEEFLYWTMELFRQKSDDLSMADILSLLENWHRLGAGNFR